MASTTPRRNSIVGLAWRNLWRNPRRTLLTLSSIVFGLFLAVLITAMQDRNWADMIDLAARMGNGHVTLEHEGYREEPTLDHSIRLSAEEGERITDARFADGFASRVVAPILLSTAAESFGAGLMAIDPDRETEETLTFLEGLDVPNLFGERRRGIVLGKRLARNLEAELGDKVVYTLTDKFGEMTSGLARVSHIVETGVPSVDRGICLLPLSVARRVVGYDSDESSQIAVFVDDQRKSEAVAQSIQTWLDDGRVAQPWFRSRPELAGFIAAKVGGAVIASLFIGLLVSAGIFNTLFVSVMERVREFGIMLAIGWSPGRLFRLVMAESAWLAIIGLVLAAVVTAGPYLYLSSVGIDVSSLIQDGDNEIAGVSMMTKLRVGIFPKNLAIIAALGVLAVLASGIYPALKAGRVSPVESIRVG